MLLGEKLIFSEIIMDLVLGIITEK